MVNLFLKYSVKCSITFNTNQTAEDIQLVVKLDDRVLDQWTFTAGVKHLIFEVEDTEDTVARAVTIEMLGKTEDHTIVDAQGEIVMDHSILVTNITFDEIDVTDQFCHGNCCYMHSNIKDGFYGFIGINGIVYINFYTPLWKWFLSRCN